MSLTTALLSVVIYKIILLYNKNLLIATKIATLLNANKTVIQELP